MIAPQFPEPGLVALVELQRIDPLGRLPEVEVGDDAARRAALSAVLGAAMLVAGVPVPLAIAGALAVGVVCGFVNGALIAFGTASASKAA